MSDCIEWHLSRDACGYGRKRVQGRLRSAHRLAYVQHHGLSFEDIEGLSVMHICDNPPCVNVDHLRLGTHADNMADRGAKGRSRGGSHPGESNPTATLTEYAVRWIRSYHATGDYEQKELAEMFGVSRATMSRVITRKVWKHV